ncbi:MAG: T9SS type A sorting domain-containing protein [Cryomorphaceae bacterium]
MLAVCCAIVFGAFLTTDASAQGNCLNTSSFGSADIALEGPNGELITIATNSWQTEYSTITGVPVGEDIEFNFDSPGAYITVRSDSSNGAVVAQGLAPVTVSSASGADLFPHWNTNDTCGTAQIGTLTTAQCVSCATICPDGNPGEACDDGDAGTVGDVIGEDCVCAGVAPGNCLNTSPFGSADLSTAGSNLVTIATNQWQTEYSTTTGVPVGEDIEFVYDSPGAYITVRSDSSSGAVVAQGFSPVTVTAASGSDLFAHYNTDDACGTATVGTLSTVQCLTCAAVCPDGSNPGEACDLGDGSVGNTVQSDCSCSGGFFPADNDNCTDVTSALQCGVTVEGTTEGATVSEGLNDLCNGFTSDSAEDVWYAFQANGTDSYTITVDTNAATSSSLMDAVIFVYSGSCGALTEIACADSNFTFGGFSGETVSLDTPAAGVYYVRVYNWNDGGEPFTITLDCESSCSNPFPAVDAASLSTTFTGNSFLTEWDAVPGQIGCQVQVRFAGGSILGAQIVGGAGASSFNIPGGVLQPGTDYEWRVRCGCSQTPLVAGPFSSWQLFSTPGGAAISSLPNPTEGQSNVTFTVVEEGYTTLEVYDMSGRLVDAIFAGNAQANSDYRFEFDGSALPNGVYIYRLTTENEVVNDKFMIAK